MKLPFPDKKAQIEGIFKLRISSIQEIGFY